MEAIKGVDLERRLAQLEAKYHEAESLKSKGKP